MKAHCIQADEVPVPFFAKEDSCDEGPVCVTCLPELSVPLVLLAKEESCNWTSVFEISLASRPPTVD